MATRNQMVVAAMAAAVLGGIATSAQAALVNPSFETDPLPTPSTTKIVPTGWNWHATGYNFETELQSNTGWSGGDGAQSLVINYNAYVYQDVGALEPDTTYTLTAAIGVYYFGPQIKDISLINGTDWSGTVLASAVTDSLPRTGDYDYSFHDLSVSFTTGSTVSGDLVVAIRNPNGAPGYVDNVRLTQVAVPEPASLALLGLGGVGLLARRRRHA